MTATHRGTAALRVLSLIAAALVALTALTSLAMAQTPAPALAAPTGNAQRGKVVFDTTLRCFACHGYDGQTGSPRLVPMARAEEIFLAYVRKPATPGMPSFAATSEQELRDVYAYIRSIPQAAPPAESIPLLKGIVDGRAKTNP
jgi:mono/diheme cytochrome c family protein